MVELAIFEKAVVRPRNLRVVLVVAVSNEDTHIDDFCNLFNIAKSGSILS